VTEFFKDYLMTPFDSKFKEKKQNQTKKRIKNYTHKNQNVKTTRSYK